MVFERLRPRSTDESGFTLVELMVVMVILALLAAIAIPSFLSQRGKAQDADAKSAARTAQVALEAYAVDHGGSYADAGMADLEAIEATLTGRALAVSSTETSYEIIAVSETGNEFTVRRAASGMASGSCTTPGRAGCPASGTWG